MLGRCLGCKSFSFKLNEEHYCSYCANRKMLMLHRQRDINRENPDDSWVTPVVLGAVIGSSLSNDGDIPARSNDGPAVSELMQEGESGGGGAEGSFDSEESSSSSEESNSSSEESSSSSSEESSGDSCGGCDSCGGGGDD